MAKYVHLIEISTQNQIFSSQEELHNFLVDLVKIYPQQFDIIENKISNMVTEESLLSRKTALDLNTQKTIFVSKIFSSEEKATEYDTWITQQEGYQTVVSIFSSLGWTVESTKIFPITEEKWLEILMFEINNQQ